jgi:hypothetical protein
MKKRSIVSGALVMLALGFIAAGCSTFPKSNFVAQDTTYDVLGLLPGTFESYEDALATARKAYPTADAVIKIKARFDDNLLPSNGTLGYAAVKFKAAEAQSQKKFLGIF